MKVSDWKLTEERRRGQIQAHIAGEGRMDKRKGGSIGGHYQHILFIFIIIFKKASSIHKMLGESKGFYDNVHELKDLIVS